MQSKEVKNVDLDRFYIVKLEATYVHCIFELSLKSNYGDVNMYSSYEFNISHDLQ